MQRGKSLYGPHFSLKVGRAAAGEESSFSFVVSKKAVKTAVKRNIVKRRGYHVLRDIFDEFKKPYRGIFFAKKGAGALSFSEFQSEILSLLKKARII